MELIELTTRSHVKRNGTGLVSYPVMHSRNQLYSFCNRFELFDFCNLASFIALYDYFNALHEIISINLRDFNLMASAIYRNFPDSTAPQDPISRL